MNHKATDVCSYFFAPLNNLETLKYRTWLMVVNIIVSVDMAEHIVFFKQSYSYVLIGGF